MCRGGVWILILTGVLKLYFVSSMACGRWEKLERIIINHHRRSSIVDRLLRTFFDDVRKVCTVRVRVEDIFLSYRWVPGTGTGTVRGVRPCTCTGAYAVPPGTGTCCCFGNKKEDPPTTHHASRRARGEDHEGEAARRGNGKSTEARPAPPLCQA